MVFSSGDNLVISGFRWPDNNRRSYAGRSWSTVDRIGDGQVILFAFDPLYRGVCDAPGGMLLNAIYLGAPGLAGAGSGR